MGHLTHTKNCKITRFCAHHEGGLQYQSRMTKHGKGPCDDTAEQIKHAFGKSLPPTSYRCQVADTQEFLSEDKKQFKKI